MMDYTKDELNVLRDNFLNKSYKEIGKMIGRSKDSVKIRIKKMGLKLPESVITKRRSEGAKKGSESAAVKKNSKKSNLKFSGYNIYSVTYLAYINRRKRIKRKFTPEAIFEDVCLAMEVNINDASSKQRDEEFTFCRQLYFYLLKRIFRPDMTFKDIGKTMGRDHTTVIHSVQKIEDGLKVKDPKLMIDWFNYTENSKYYNDGKKEL